MELEASLFLALQVLEAWVTILMFPSVTCLNKLLSLVQSCLIRGVTAGRENHWLDYLRNTVTRMVMMKMKRTGM